MKRSKRIYILLAVLAVVCIATFIVSRVEEHKEKIKNTDAVILEIPPDSVKTLSWEHDSKKFALHKDDKWIYDADEQFPVDQDRIDKLLKVFEKFGAAFIIEDVENFGQYGLDKPVCTIRLSDGDKSYEIKLGDFSKMDAQRYVSIGDGNVYLVKKDPLDEYGVELKDLIDNDKAPSFDKVQEIRFEGAESYNIVYEENSADTYCKDDVYFARLGGGKHPLDTSRVNSYLTNIRTLKLTDYVTYKATDAELKKYGLDAPELMVTVRYAPEGGDGEETFTISVSRDPEEKKKAENAESEDKKDEEITAYARVGQSKIVYKISADDYKDLMAASFNDLRHQEVFPADLDIITQFDISLEGGSYTITAEKKANEITYYYQGEKLDITSFRSAFRALKAEKFTDEKPAQKEEISLTVHLESDNFPQVKIQLYRYDGTYCLAVVDGKPVSLVRRTNVVDLIEAVHKIVLG